MIEGQEHMEGEYGAEDANHLRQQLEIQDNESQLL